VINFHNVKIRQNKLNTRDRLRQIRSKLNKIGIIEYRYFKNLFEIEDIIDPEVKIPICE
jgi:hypothetical protein